MAADPLSRVLSALADPTRRDMVARLAVGDATVLELAEPYEVTVQAVSKHLKVLERAGLITRGRTAQLRPSRLHGVPLKDATGGFNVFRAATLRGIGLNDISSAGYCFQVDLSWRALKAGYKVVEVPITFVERERGDSKMSQKIVIEALIRTTLWGTS